MLSCMIRSVGDSKTPVLFLGMASILNIILDILLIRWAGMGVAGAAVATVASQTISGLMCLAYIYNRFFILQPAGDQWRPKKERLGTLCAMGIPMGLQYSITAIGSVILQASVNTLGTKYVAAITAGSKLSIIFCCPFDALGTAIATYSGQNTGAGKLERVRRGVNCCMGLGSAYSLLALALFSMFGIQLATLFAEASEVELLTNARTYLVWNSVFYIPLAAVNIYRFSIQGMGHSRMAILAGVFEMVARAVVGKVFVPIFGYFAACLAGPVAWIAADAFLIPTFLH